MRFGTWNVRSMYRPRPLTKVARKVVRYRLDSVDMQEVRWDKGGAVQQRIILFVERMRCFGACGPYEQEESFIHGFDGKPAGKKQI
jgi:hypothetical protein